MTSNSLASPRAPTITSSPPPVSSAGVLNWRPSFDSAMARSVPVGKFATADAAEAPIRQGKVTQIKAHAVATGQYPRLDPTEANVALASMVSVRNVGSEAKT